MKLLIVVAAVAAMSGSIAIADSYEDPIVAVAIAERMEMRIAEMRALGVIVEHNYSIRHANVPVAYTASFGSWEAYAEHVNVPMTPTITNLFVMEEEFAHVLGSDAIAYGSDPVHQLWEEFRAKRYAELKVSEFIAINAEAAAFNDFTVASYIKRARDMSRYTRQTYGDEVIATIRAHAEAVAFAQYESQTIAIVNSGDEFAALLAR